MVDDAIKGSGAKGAAKTKAEGKVVAMTKAEGKVVAMTGFSMPEVGKGDSEQMCFETKDFEETEVDVIEFGRNDVGGYS